MCSVAKRPTKISVFGCSFFFFFLSSFLFLFPSFETDSSPLLQLPLHRSLASLFPHHLLLLRSHPKQLSRSLLETSLAMSSPSDSKPALGDGEQQPHLPLDAPPSLPAPPPPPACSVPTSSSASATASFFNPWPFNDPSVLLFLDPFSPEAQELKKTLEVSSTLSSPPSSLPSPPPSHLLFLPSLTTLLTSFCR